MLKHCLHSLRYMSADLLWKRTEKETLPGESRMGAQISVVLQPFEPLHLSLVNNFKRIAGKIEKLILDRLKLSDVACHDSLIEIL
jgi:hypothetical protein